MLMIDDAPPFPSDYRRLGCGECLHGTALGFDFSMALQPIVDLADNSVFAQEALVRGTAGEPAGHIFQQVSDANLYRFDQTCRVKAIQLASRLGIGSLLSINFLPNAVYRPELCIRTTLAAAEQYNFPIERIIFEATEGERVIDLPHLRAILSDYQHRGFLTAIDDFGAGNSGLNLLADFQPDLVKLDMGLIRGIDQSRSRQSIVRGTVAICDELSIRVVAEGVETGDELRACADLGISLVQGYYLARPAFEAEAELRSSF
jgi:EAL domain-containing protein (putative c-di-GMP-specific phosphodiesterase class I)